MIWAAQSSIAKTEKDGILDLDMRHPAMWHFINPKQLDARGYPTGWEIMPGATAVSAISLDDPAMLRQVHEFHQSDIGRHRGKPVFGRFGFSGWPFDQQPLFSMRL